MHCGDASCKLVYELLFRGGVSVDIRRLRYFVAVSEAGSLSRASKNLRIAQPALSQSLKRLEEDLETDLFTRHARGMKLNEVGERLLQHARAILRDLDSTHELIRSSVLEPSGEVRLGLPTTTVRALTVPLSRTLSERYPEIRLNIVEGMSGHLNTWIEDQTLDIALLFNPTFRHDDRLMPFMAEDLRLICLASCEEAKLDVIQFKDLVSLKLALPSSPHIVRNIVEKVASTQQLPLPRTVNLDSLPGIIEMVRSGYSTILPASGFLPELISGEFVAIPIVEPAIDWELYMLAPADGARSRAAIAVIALVQEIISELVTEGYWPGRLF